MIDRIEVGVAYCLTDTKPRPDVWIVTVTGRGAWKIRGAGLPGEAAGGARRRTVSGGGRRGAAVTSYF